MSDYGLWDKLPFSKLIFGVACILQSGREGYIDIALEIVVEGSSNELNKYLKIYGSNLDNPILLGIKRGLLINYSDDTVEDQVLFDVAQVVQDILLAVHSGCEAKLCRLTDKQKAINKKRVAKGKKPLYEETLIKIKPSVYYKPTGSRKRYTPTCAHQRRGHFRTLQSGKKVWVRDCKVSEGHERTIKHNYVFEYEPM